MRLWLGRLQMLMLTIIAGNFTITQLRLHDGGHRAIPTHLACTLEGVVPPLMRRGWLSRYVVFICITGCDLSTVAAGIR